MKEQLTRVITKVDEDSMTVYLPYNTQQAIIDAWNKKGYKVQLEIV